MNSDEQKQKEDSNVNVELILNFIIVCTNTERGVNITQRKTHESVSSHVTSEYAVFSFLYLFLSAVHGKCPKDMVLY